MRNKFLSAFLVSLFSLNFVLAEGLLKITSVGWDKNTIFATIVLSLAIILILIYWALQSRIK